MKVKSYLGEVWKYIEEYEGYQVSNFGRVKSLERDVYNPRYGKKRIKEKILKTGKRSSGHLCVRISKNGVVKPYSVHRLVAEAFIPNPEMKSDVHHIDHNPANNNVENLVWLTKKEHVAEHPERYEASSKAARKALAKHINQFTRDGMFVKAWYSAREIERELGYANQHIIDCCKGKLKTYKGFKWKYAEDC